MRMTNADTQIRISSNDEKAIAECRGQIAASEVEVVDGLSKIDAAHGRRWARVIRIEQEKLDAAIRDEFEMQALREKQARRRQNVDLPEDTEPPKTKTAQEIFDEMTKRPVPTLTPLLRPQPPAPSIALSERRLPTAEELRNPPATISKHDVLALGRWAESISAGRTRVE
jgi:hypothetical protein